MTSPPRKVLIYATSAQGLLVFDEPDFPEVPLQVPGGTVEPGEDDLSAARREVEEETGLACTPLVEPMGIVEFRAERDGEERVQWRSRFRLRLPGEFPSRWEHLERTPSTGVAPIRFRLFWIDPREARWRLGLQMGRNLGDLAA